MYIINPLTKTPVLLLSNEGRNLLKQYINQYQSGGTHTDTVAPDPTATLTSNDEFKDGDMILAKYPRESKDIYYSAKITKNFGGKAFKIIYTDLRLKGLKRPNTILSKKYIKAYTPPSGSDSSSSDSSNSDSSSSDSSSSDSLPSSSMPPAEPHPVSITTIKPKLQQRRKYPPKPPITIVKPIKSIDVESDGNGGGGGAKPMTVKATPALSTTIIKNPSGALSKITFNPSAKPYVPGGGGGKPTAKPAPKTAVKSTAKPYVPVLTPLPKLPDMVAEPGPFKFKFMTHNIGQCANYKWGLTKKKSSQFYVDSPYRNIIDYFSNLRPSSDLFCLQEVEIDLNNMKVNRYVNGRFQIDDITYEFIMKPYNYSNNSTVRIDEVSDIPSKIINNSVQIECSSPTELAKQKFNKHICIAVVWNVAKFRLENWKETDDLKNLLPNKERALYVNLECINGSIIHVVSYHGTNKRKFKISKTQLQTYMSNWKSKYFIMAGDFNRTIGEYITKLPPIKTSYSQLRENKGLPIDHVIYQNVIPIGDAVEIPTEFICTTTACDTNTSIIPYINDYDHLPIVQEFEIA